jgi:Subtilase family
MNSHRPSTRIRLARALTIAAFACGAICVTGSVDAGTATETDVMAWLDDVSPAITIDRSTNCMPGATPMATQSTDAVAYRNDRIVIRSGASNPTVAGIVDSKLDTMYSTPGHVYVGPIERITFPTPPGGAAITPVLSVTLLPRPGGLPHQIVALARRLRSESGTIGSPDYAYTPSGPYSYYWPYGYPQKTSTLTTPRNNVVPGTSNLIGSTIKTELYDTGLAAPNPTDLPTTTKLSSTDDEQPNIVNNGAKMVDYPHAFHGTAIAGVLTTIAPGMTIQEVRVNDRSGLLTDVSAARGMASSLRTLALADYPDVIVNAFGSAACNVDATAVGGADLRPVGLEAVVEVVDKFDPKLAQGMVIVASAGNVASTRPHYPAAFESVVSVGALDGTVDGDGNPWTSKSRTAPLADFTNRGPWVKFYATGVDIPTTHGTGLRFETGGDIIDGKATVSGSSYSGPQFAGLIAEVMSTSKIKARAAVDVLRTYGAAPLPQCGGTTVESGKAVVLRELGATATDPALENPTTC